MHLTLVYLALACPGPRRDVVVPPEQADSSDAFGLLRRSIPRRIGRSEGLKARVLVKSSCCVAALLHPANPCCPPCPAWHLCMRDGPSRRLQPPPTHTYTHTHRSPQVCAPSNSALDEIVLRLITTGLTDQEGRVFTPNVVRWAEPPPRPHSKCAALLPACIALRQCTALICPSAPPPRHAAPAGACGREHPPQRAERGPGHLGGAPPGRRGRQGGLGLALPPATAAASARRHTS
jgi:hypothetical protein